MATAKPPKAPPKQPDPEENENRADDDREAIEERQRPLRCATEHEVTSIRNHRDRFAEQSRRFSHGNGPQPVNSERPSAGSPKWTREIAKHLRQVEGAEELAPWYRHEDVVAVLGEDLLGQTLRGLLRDCDEFQALNVDMIQVRWSTAAIIHRDGPLEEVALGRVKVIPLADRETWPTTTDVPAPLFRLDLSLPTLLLAEGDDLEPVLHALLMRMGAGGYLRKPDIAAFSATLGRYGIRHAREIQAVAHAMGHPSTPSKLSQHKYDPDTGQGLLWQPRHCAGEWN